MTSRPNRDRKADEENVDLLRLLASAVVSLEECQDLGSFALPYPLNVQRALDHLALRAVLDPAVTAPGSVSDLVRWCQEFPGKNNHGIVLPQDVVSPDDTLVDHGSARPTVFCRDWAVEEGDVHTSEVLQETVVAALTRCRKNNAQEEYVRFRRFLIDHPVTTREELFDLAESVQGLSDIVAECYVDPPVHYLRFDPDDLNVPGTLSCCAHCGCALAPLLDGGWACELTHCRPRRDTVSSRRLSMDSGGGVHHLKRPLRQFVTGPGLSEMAFEAILQKLGIPYQIWPDVDTYDFRIDLPDGRVWAVDVKDWAAPSLLGRRAKRPEGLPQDHLFVLAVPDHQFQRRIDYRRIFHRHCPPDILPQIRLLSFSESKEELSHALT